MLKKGWSFIKENVVTIITVITALLTFVYAALRLCIYVYWKGYFRSLNIDMSAMNINFDKSVFLVVFVSIILFVVLFFVAWVDEIVTDIINKERELQLKGIKKLISKIKACGKILLSSIIILSIINLPLILLLTPINNIKVTIIEMFAFLFVFYVMEMLFIFSQLITRKNDRKKEKITERDIAFKIIAILATMLIILAMLFYGGTEAIDKKTSVQLVENEKYMISYCDGERYVLHKVEYAGEQIVIYRNEQKIVAMEDCEISIKQVKEIDIRD